MPNVLSTICTPNYVNNAWNYSMGYQFKPLVDGSITALGGYFSGTKTVKLYNSSYTVIASASVTSANAWAYTNITPVAVTANSIYYVVVELAGNGGAYSTSFTTPVTNNNVTILESVYQTPSGTFNSSMTVITSQMYGCADITIAFSSNYTKSNADTSTLSDNITPNLTVVPIAQNGAESVGLADEGTPKMLYWGFDISQFDIAQFDITQKAWSQSGDDNLSLSDDAVKVMEDVNGDSTTLSDSYHVDYKDSNGDSSTISDGVALTSKPSIPDSTTLSDGYSLKPTVDSDESSLSIADNVTNTVKPTNADSTTLSDGYHADVKQLEADSSTLSDALTTTGSFYRTSDESVTLADNYSLRPGLDNDESSVSLSDGVTTQPNVHNDETAVLLFDTYTVNYKQQVGETLLLLDDAIKTIKDVLNDSLAFVDNTTFNALTSLTDSVLLADSVYVLIQAILANDSLTISDLVSLKPNVDIDDVLSTISDSFTLNAKPNIPDTISLLDSISSVITLYKSDLLTIADALSSKADYKLSQDETIGMIESIANNLAREANDDAISLAEQLAMKILTSSDDTVTSLDDYNMGIKPKYDEVTSLAESIISVVKPVVNDLLSAVDTLKSYVRDNSNNDSASMLDSIGLLTKKLADDTISLADSISSGIGITIPYTNIFDFASFDNALFDVDNGGEVLGITDSITYNRILSQVLEDTLSLVDGLTLNAKAVISDSSTIYEDYHSTFRSGAKDDPISLIDSNSLNIEPLITDSLTLVESLMKNIVTTYADSVSLADDYQNLIKLVIAEAMSLSEDYHIDYSSVINEAVNLSDSTASSVMKFIDDPITLAETVVDALGELDTDSMELTDSMILQAMPLVAESLSVSDDLLNLVIGVRMDEVISVVETYYVSIQTSKSDSLTLSDTISQLWQAYKNFDDTLTLLDSSTIGLLKIITETAVVIDDIVNQVNTSQLEGIGLNDNFNISMFLVSAVSDALTLADSYNINDLMSNGDIMSLVEDLKASIVKTLSDTLGLSDLLMSDIIKNIDDLLLLVDSSLMYFQQSPTSDSQMVSDSLVTLLTIKRQFDEILNIVDYLKLNFQMMLSEIVNLTDSYNMLVQSSKQEVIDLIESLGFDMSKPLPQDLVGVIDESYIRAILGIDDNLVGLKDLIEGRKFKVLQQVFIEGIQVPVVGLKIQHSVQDRVSTCSFTIHAPSQEVISLAQHRSEVRAYLLDGDGNTEYFGGRIIQNPVSGRTAVSSQLEITADDWTSLANDVLVSESYTSDKDGTLTDILIKMWQKYYPKLCLYTQVVSTDKTIDNLVFNYDSLFDATEAISNILGWVWYVDWTGGDRVLKFYPPSSAIKPVTLSELNRNIVAGTARFGQNEQMYNSVYVFGGDGLSDWYTENTLADGQKRAYAIGSTSKKIDKYSGVTVKVNNGTELKWGYVNIDDPNSFDILIDFDNMVVLWRDNNKPVKDAIISMTYKFNYPILVHLTDDASIGKYGLSETRIQDSKINTVQNARERGKSFLRDNAIPLGYGSCEVFVEGLRAGEFITVNMPKYNVSSLYEIVEIEKWVEASVIRRKVTLNISDDVENRIAKRLKDFSQRISSLESEQRPEDLIVQRVLKNTRNLGLNCVGTIKGNITYGLLDNPGTSDRWVAMLQSTGSTKGFATSPSDLSDNISSKPMHVEKDTVGVKDWARVGTAILDTFGKFDQSTFGTEVAS